MYKTLSEIISGKRVLILGFGKEGRSTYNTIRKACINVHLGIADKNAFENIPDCADVNNCILHTGSDYLDCLDDYDVVIKSPGVVLPKDPSGYRCTITSQTEIFLLRYRHQIIGITGTKGKSTVATLLQHIFAENNVPCILAGNIGIPVFDIIDEVRPQTKVIFEMSCHQLEHCKFSPHTAVILNFFEDHLDHYGTFEKYIQAKKNIYLNQEPQDILYYGETSVPEKGEAVSKTVFVDTVVLPDDSFETISEAGLLGQHNLLNCAFAYAVASNLGISEEQYISAVKTYTPLPHRLEYIGAHGGVDYYDDSISTTAESAINAVESIPNAATILLGGMDRGIDYTELVEYLSKSRLKNIICMYESGKRIYDMLTAHEGVSQSVIYCKDLFAAIKEAKTVTSEGAACILSPASASYGDFKNFEERGDKYKEMVVR